MLTAGRRLCPGTLRHWSARAAAASPALSGGLLMAVPAQNGATISQSVMCMTSIPASICFAPTMAVELELVNARAALCDFKCSTHTELSFATLGTSDHRAARVELTVTFYCLAHLVGSCHAAHSGWWQPHSRPPSCLLHLGPKTCGHWEHHL